MKRIVNKIKSIRNRTKLEIKAINLLSYSIDNPDKMDDIVIDDCKITFNLNRVPLYIELTSSGVNIIKVGKHITLYDSSKHINEKVEDKFNLLYQLIKLDGR